MDGGDIFPPREGASRAVYGKGESLAPRKMKFQVLPSLLLLPPLSLSLPPLFHREPFRGIVYADETCTRVGEINV